MRIALAGYGQEGKASHAYWNVGGNELTVADERDSVDGLPDDAPTILGAGAFTKLTDFDLIIRSPSVNPKKLPYGNKVWSATNEFFEKCPAPIIGVTGTKGKGTTSSLIASILRAAGKTVHLVGNIGVPAITELQNIHADDIVVFEISSFQLWDAKRSPHVAVVLGIEPDHLDVHDGMQDYINAKANIRRFQYVRDVCVYHPTNQYSYQVAATPLVNEPGEHVESIDLADRYAVEAGRQVYAKDGYFCVQGRKICPIDSLSIVGAHNVENACAAMSAVSGLRLHISDEQYAKGLADFKGLPHRIKFIAEKNGVKYYDDSYSSAPTAAMAAIRSFDAPKVILLGGYDKGADFSGLARLIADDRTVKRVIAYGQTKERIVRELQGADVERSRIVTLATTDFPEIVARAAAESEPGDVVVLSPACASFDMFKNFTQRGELFIDIVESL